MSDPVLEALNRAADEVTPEDVDNVIKYLRKHRQDYLSGKKVTKEKEQVDVAKLLGDIKPKITLAGRRF